MKTLYAACLSRLGLSQTQASALHGVRLDTVKNWCSGRSAVPAPKWDDLRDLEVRIVDRSEEMREAWEVAGSPPIEINDAEADGAALMAAADFVLGTRGPVQVGQSAATRSGRTGER